MKTTATTPTIDSKFLERIKEFAFNKHEHPGESQRYGAAPYSVHLDDVHSNVKRYIHLIDPADAVDVEAAAYCHDLIEDTEVDINTLKEKTNIRIAELVYLVSNERGRNRKEKNFKTYPKIWNNPLATFIKLCDRIANTKNSRNTGHRMYKVYCEEYPIFRYALKKKIDDPYLEMWNELDELCEFCPKDFHTKEISKILDDTLSIGMIKDSKDTALNIDGKEDAVKRIIELLKETNLIRL